MTMPTESLSGNESNGKRKVKNKVPKRLRRKNKQNEINTEENRTDPALLTKEETTPANTDNHRVDVSTDETSIHYWRNCTKKAVDILEKQAANRRKFFIERHQERIDSLQCLLSQREQIDKLTEENHSMSQSFTSLRAELHTKEEMIKTLEDKLYDHDEFLRDNEFLRVQLKLMEQKFERFTIEYSKKLEENRQHEHEYHEQIQSLLDEIERIKRDLVLEEYRKQEAERKVRYYEEKNQIEQNLNKKMQQDLIQLKQELKSIHIRYDALQIEMLAMHKANNNDISLIPTKDTNENDWTKKRTIEQDMDEPLETKRSKRKTRDRTESSASTASNGSDKQNKIATISSNLTVTRKTLKSKKTTKKHLPMVTVTHASPAVDQTASLDKDAAQLLLPSSVSATSDGSTPTPDSNNTSCESQPLKPRPKKASRYPCRRAQRPVKQIDPTDQVQIESQEIG